MRIGRKQSQQADEVYESIGAAGGGRVGDLADVRSAMEQKIPAADLTALLDEYYWQLTRAADERALRRGRSPQLGLFTGQPESLDGYVALGDVARVKKRYMVNADWVTHLQLMNDNVQEVSHRYLLEQADHAKLLPYLAAGLTTEKALEEYWRAHPQPAAATP